jgi:hypothetical protein
MNPNGRKQEKGKDFIKNLLSTENIEKMLDKMPLEWKLNFAIMNGIKIDPDKLIELANKEKYK